MDEIEKNNGEIIIYRTEDGRTQLEVRLEDENVWLSQQQIANLFGVQRPAITKHLRNIFESGELEENSVSSILEHTASDGKNYKTQFYNLDAIISVGYRVNSLQATHFRRWATERLKEYLIKGFAMDDKRLKEMGGGGYWYELLNRIRDIRSSEKVLYRQVLDLYATSVDYDPKADESIRFFKIVQNKLHYAAHGHTAAEVIFERADAEKPFMGLTTFPGEQPRKEDVLIAKNYLNEKELKILNNLVSGYFDFAEIQAIKRSPMYMSDYIHHLDLILSTTGEQVLQNAGTISHEQAKQKALGEYQKYHVKTLSPVEEAYFDSIKKLTADTDYLAKEIQQATSLTEGDVKAVLESLSHFMGSRLREGERVHLDGIGYFQVKLNSLEPITSPKLKANQMKLKANIGFKADKKLRSSVSVVKVERSKLKLHSVPRSNEEIDRLLTAYFSNNQILTRSDFQGLCKLTLTTAARHIKRLKEEKKLQNINTRQSPVYIPMPGYYGKPEVEDNVK